MSYELPPRRRRVNHLKRRHAETVPRRRETDPVRRPRERDPRKNTSSNALLVILAAALLLSCALNVYSFSTANHFGKAGLIALATAAFLLLAIAATAFAIYGPLSWTTSATETSRRLPDHSAISEEHFCEISEARGIRLRIATQAYSLLLPHCHRKMRTRLDDRLREDLHLTDTQISDLLAELLHNTDRRPRVGAPSVFATILDLLQYVQDAPRAFLYGPDIYEISQGVSFIRPSAESRTMKARHSQSDSLPALKRVVSITDDAFFRSRNKPATFHDIDSQY
jgi:hypothetical protein